MDILYIDLRKAFDTVPHKRLLAKLRGYGIDGNVYSWIEDFLKDRKQRVLVNGENSSWTEIDSGIPQGSVLGPVLFLIYVNDLPDVVECMTKMFADDTKLYGKVDGIEGSAEIQQSLNNVCTWMDTWQLGLNKQKCKQLHIGNNNVNKYYLTDKDRNNFEVTQVEQEKDLGIIFDSKLKFSQHINSQIAKANINLGIIFRTFNVPRQNFFCNTVQITGKIPLRIWVMCMVPNVQKRHNCIRKCPTKSNQNGRKSVKQVLFRKTNTSRTTVPRIP